MKMGTLAWGEKSGGRLRGADKAHLMFNLMRVQAREGWDRVRAATGVLRPDEQALESLEPPRTALVEDALRLAFDTHAAPLLNHSWRTYYFGALIARQERVEFDPELFFAAAILHDLALTKDHPVPLCKACFAISGGARVRDHLDGCGHSREQVDKVSEAIALHLNLYVSRRTHGAEAYLVSRGATCDLFGVGHRRLAPGNVSEVFGRFPRAGVIEALQFETADHMKGSRPHFLTKLMGGKAPITPFDRF